MNYFSIMSSVPEGKKGDWKVERFVVSKEEASRFNASLIFNRQSWREIKAGTYTKLTHNREVIMSDTPAEKSDHAQIIWNATGNILLNGLGLGWTVEACMQKKEVIHITTIEIEHNVIELVGSYLLKKYPKRLSVIQADALVWKPPKGTHYDCVWHDIWPTICGDNYESMKKLRRKYGRKTNWQDAWCSEWVKELDKTDML